MTPPMRWPNLVSPGLEAFDIDAPSDWRAIELPTALLAFLGPEADGFRPNLVIFGERLPDEITLDEVADRTLDDVGSDTVTTPLADAEIKTADMRPLTLRESITVIDGFTLRRLIMATEMPTRSPGGLRSVFVLVATHLRARPSDGDVLTSTIASFRPIHGPSD
ncbi:hypothetical protein ACLQ2R_04940 [Streptosporangium sp. DT93]|uniref:hypothetical protein n=1 Tax=Streptosporangium sp. DT93 TaxID=3393428 RepID=UPI003CFAA448